LDELLIRRGLADSVATSQAMIMAGDVVVNEQRMDKPGAAVPDDAVIRLKDEGRFVSRGGDKLLGAIEDFKIAEMFSGKSVLDVGASTGGFTDCVLSLGASHVTAVDVGTAQLAWRLRNDPRVLCVEKTDIRKFQPGDPLIFDWVVADVSFTSLARLVPDIKKSAPRASLLLLIKPQFELPRELIPEGGIVRLDESRQMAAGQVRQTIVENGYQIIGTVDARVVGRQGNREIFIFASPGGQN
jgi:23S rRNA (cytidine1920-2'-O)/16S rRNA (cytidine1409-2'-O)-methyltransferase